VTWTQLASLSPVFVSVIAGVVAMLTDAFGSRRAAALASAGLLAIAGGLGIWQAFTPPARIIPALAGGGGFAAAWGVIALTAALSVFGGTEDLAVRRSGGGVAALIGFATAGSMLLAGSLDLLFGLIALETIAVCSYAIVVAGGTDRAAEAGMKYVIQGALATGLFLVGMAIHIGVTGGGTDYASVSTGMPEFALPATAATVFLLAAYAFKLGAAPFHSWAPDAFETAPPAGGAFMASGPKVGAILGLMIFFGATVEPVAIRTVSTLSHVILFATLAVGSILIGNLAGLRQTSYLRMLGYSGVAQIGYALVGLAVGITAIPAVTLLVSTYAVAAVGAFLYAQFVRSVRPGWDGSIAGMAGVAKEYPLSGVALAVLMLSLTGIPLTAGFWGKLYVFTFAVNAGLEWLVLIGVLGSVVSFGYYGAVLRSAFFEDSPTTVAAEDPALGEGEGAAVPDRRAAAAIVACALAVVVVGLLPLAIGLTPLLEFFYIT